MVDPAWRRRVNGRRGAVGRAGFTATSGGGGRRGLRGWGAASMRLARPVAAFSKPVRRTVHAAGHPLWARIPLWVRIPLLVRIELAALARPQALRSDPCALADSRANPSDQGGEAIRQ